jgi:hypothetical protein
MENKSKARIKMRAKRIKILNKALKIIEIVVNKAFNLIK